MSVVREALGEKYEQYVETGQTSKFRGVEVAVLSRFDLYAMIAKQNELLENAFNAIQLSVLADILREADAQAATLSAA